MKLEIMLFAGLADRLGSTRISVEMDKESVSAGELLLWLAERYPPHADALKSSFVARNQAYAEADQLLSESDELALIPPVSGGQGEDRETQAEPAGLDDRYFIQTTPLAADRIIAKVSHPNHGASLVFIGTTREMTAGERTVRLEYDAYVPMALRTLQQIGDEIDARWPGVLCAISHRIGVVEIEEASVIIAVSAPHRDICYEASRYAIERLKQIVPIWKKEIWENGAQWKGHQLGPWNPVQ